MQQVVCDTHAHLYPCYDLTRSFDWALRNLSRSASSADAVLALILVERFDCFFFRDAVAGILALPDPYQIKPTVDGSSLWIEGGNGGRLLIISGRQFVTQGGVELLCLGRDLHLADGLPLNDTIQSIILSGGLPVISWAPGKWLGRRGKIIQSLIRERVGQPILAGDTSLRPWFWQMPRLLRDAQQAGFRLVAGSDPLPFPGEEQRLGCFATTLAADLDLNKPGESILTALASRDTALSSVGSRASTLEFFLRLARNEIVRRNLI